MAVNNKISFGPWDCNINFSLCIR